MSKPACPMCEMTDVLEFPQKWECVTCGHEWERTPEPEAAAGPRVVKDAHGNVLSEGDCVVLIKDLKLGGGNQVLKGGSKSKPIRLVDGDHEIDCKRHFRRPQSLFRQKGLTTSKLRTARHQTAVPRLHPAVIRG